MTFSPSIAVHFGQGSYQIWYAHDIPEQFDNLLILADHCITFDPSNALQLGQGSTKFGGHRTFQKQLDLWVTFNLWQGHLKICS